ncbi:MAG: tetratricopeptide repeat protein [Akkermansiaceae bacterium]
MMEEFPCKEIDRLMRAGKMLDALEVAKGTNVALKQWPQGQARRTAARLTSSLGASRLSRVLDWLNWRGDPSDPEFFLQGLFTRLGYTPEIKLLPEVESYLTSNTSIPAVGRANLLALQAYFHACFRDFGPATARIAEALEIAPEESWIHVEHAVILEMEDRYEEALESADRAISLRPYYSAAVLRKTAILVHLGRDEQAIEMLKEADEKTQSPSFSGRLQSFYSEQEQHDEAMFYLNRFEERSPLADKSLKKWIASRKADFFLMADDIDHYLEWAEKSENGYHKRVSKNISKPGARQKTRIRLEVPFIRQHNMTCAPATLAALSRYWKKEHDHLQIADAICHEGTPWHKEHDWAEKNGFIAREFRVTEQSSRELIDRGIPFTLTTQAATSAHLQACIGYDERAGVLILRDPTHRHFGEIILDGLIEDHPVAGPRGMVMVPSEEKSKLDGIDLPDEAAYDAYHEFLVALDTNDRLKIDGAHVALRAVAPDHMLGLEADQRFASWKQDWVGYLRAIDAILEKAPDHSPTLLQKAGALHRLGRWQDLRKFLEEQVSKKGSEPAFAAELGELLMEDARHLESAERYLRKALHESRREARIFESIGRCMTVRKEHDEAARFRRVSATLAGTFEPYSKGYFDACRALRRSDEALDFLRERVSRFGSKSAGPWITLAESLHTLQRHDEAAQILEDAMSKRPEDGELALNAGELMVAWGNPYRTTGEKWIESSRGTVPEINWLFAKARNASFLGNRTAAIRWWKAILEEQTQSTPAWRGLVRSVAEEEGETEAIRLLDEATQRFPDDASLWTLKAEWLVDTQRGPLEALDRVLELCPEDNWVIRERALRRMQAGDKEGAEADAHHAVLLNPWSAEAHGILGEILYDADKPEEAATSFREAIKLDIDHTNSSERLIRITQKPSEKTEAISYIESEMRRQVSRGEIVLTYQNLAWYVIDPPVLLTHLQEFCSERPDLWQTWAARVEQALDMRLDDEALLAAKELTTRFPLLPRGWLELGRVHRSAGRHEDEEKAIARAGEISPGWDQAARAHAIVLEQLGRHEEAIKVLRRACTLNPLNGPNYGELADTLRRNGLKKEAFEVLSEAMEFTPFYGWAWTAGCTWAVEDHDTAEIENHLREAETKHGHLLRWHRIAADAWDCLENPEESLASVKRGLERAPKDASLRDSLAYRLWEKEDFEKALAACEAVENEKQSPVNLRGRRAWILMHSGQPMKGIEELKELLKEEPDYAWGLNELAEWHYNRSEWKELREICNIWLRASPGVSKVLGYLGMAELGLENTKEAKSAFSRAHAIDPENTHTARQLMDLQMKDGELDDAQHTLERLRHYSSSIHIDCDAVELFLKKQDVAQAITIVDSMLKNPNADENLFEYLEKLFNDNHGKLAWQDWVKKKVKSGPHPAPGYLVAYLRILPLGKLSGASKKWIKREELGSPARVAAWDFIIQKLIERRDVEGLKKLQKKNRSEFQESGRLWRTMGQAFLDLDLTKDGVAWFSDWRERGEDLDSSSYLNIAALYDSSPGDEKRLWKIAGDIRAEGFRRYPDTSNSQGLRAAYSLHLALDGKADKAEELLENYDPSQVGVYYAAMGNSALAVVAAIRENTEESRSQLTEAVTFFSKYNDLGSIRTRRFVEQSIAGTIPEFRGKISRLRKSWYPHLPQTGKTRNLLSQIGLGDMPWWVIVIIVMIILKILRALSES